MWRHYQSTGEIKIRTVLSFQSVLQCNITKLKKCSNIIFHMCRKIADMDELANQVRVPDNTRVSSIDEDTNYAVFVSYIEIYNNFIYDLLEEVQLDSINPK